MIREFIKSNPVSVIIVILGLLSWFVTIGARIESKKTGRFVSGIPGVGGILIVVGFLTSSVKWLALIGLLDIDLWYFIIVVIPGVISVERQVRKYVPPEDYEGGQVVLYSKYNKNYEEIWFPSGYGGNHIIHTIIRYVIIKKGEKYELLKIQLNGETVSDRIECDTVEECISHASKKAKFIPLEERPKDRNEF